jgi:hypothetical protein
VSEQSKPLFGRRKKEKSKDEKTIFFQMHDLLGRGQYPAVK